MSLIKAAGRDRDVDRAFSIIQRLRENNVPRQSFSAVSHSGAKKRSKDLKGTDGRPDR